MIRMLHLYAYHDQTNDNYHASDVNRMRFILKWPTKPDECVQWRIAYNSRNSFFVYSRPQSSGLKCLSEAFAQCTKLRQLSVLWLTVIINILEACIEPPHTIHGTDFSKKHIQTLAQHDDIILCQCWNTWSQTINKRFIFDISNLICSGWNPEHRYLSLRICSIVFVSLNYSTLCI